MLLASSRYACLEVPMHSSTKICTFGLFGGGNLGNDGSLEAVLSSLRRLRPEAELCCICPGPALVARDHGIAALPMRTPPPSDAFRHGPAHAVWKAVREVIDWPLTFLRVRRFSVAIVPGTGILDDLGERPWTTPLSLLRFCLMAKLAGTKVWLVSIGAGPIHHPLSRRFLLWAAQVADYRSYRDTFSRDYMSSIGLDTSKDEVYPDVAFGLPAAEPKSSINQGTAASPLLVGVGVMSYHGWKEGKSGPNIYATYLKRMVTLVQWLLDQGYRVRLITGQTSDEQVVADLQRALPGHLAEVPGAGALRSLNDVMLQIADCDAVIATRFHNVICALKMGKPTISIGYSAKFEALMADIGLSAYCQKVEQLDVELLTRQLRDLLEKRQEITSAIRAQILKYEHRLGQQEAALADMLQASLGSTPEVVRRCPI